jgi:hypothetical protein
VKAVYHQVQDISVDEPQSDTSTSIIEITNSDSESSVHIQVLQWAEVKNSDLA